jgi:biopolymer transport protein ExbD
MDMAMRLGGRRAVVSDINVTPMADIMIVLLIIFMVITPMLQKGVDVRLPAAGNTKERNDSKTIEVAIRKDSSTFLKGLRLDKQQELVPKLKEALEERADMKVMDLCREAGVEEVALIAEQKVQGGGS